MLSLIFFSSIYWLNFAILIGYQCIDFLSVLYFFAFLVFFVFPIGNCFYKLLFRKALVLERSFQAVIQMMLAIPVIAAVNFFLGITYASNLGMLLLSYAYILYSHRANLSAHAPIMKMASGWRTISSRGEQSYLLFVLALTALSTLVSVTSFRIYNFYPDHISIFGHPSDGSSYYAIISALTKHTGSFIYGFGSTLYAGDNMMAYRFLFEIFESVFVKFSGVDIVLFQSVIIAQSLMLLLFCIAFLPCLKSNAPKNYYLRNSWNLIFSGLIIVAIFAYFRQISLLTYSIAAFHSFMAWMFILAAVKILLSLEKLRNGEINADFHTRTALVFALFLTGFIIHIVYTFILFISFLLYLIYQRFNDRQKKYVVAIWSGSILISILLFASVFKNCPLVLGDGSVSIYNFGANVADIQRYFNDLTLLKPIYAGASAFIFSNTAASNIVGSFYALFCFTGYFFIIPVYYFFFAKSRFKFFFANILLGIYVVVLLINYQITVRPSFLAMYMPNVTMLVIAFMTMETLLVTKFIRFPKAPVLLKISLIAMLTAAVLISNTVAFATSKMKLDIPKKLYDVMLYVKKDTPQNSVILHNLKSSDYYAYFSGFAYRNVVLERGAYAYAFIDNEKEVRTDIGQFCNDPDISRRLNILNKYSVTHVLSSPDCSFVLPQDKFRPVFSNNEYVLYQYLKPR